MAKIRKFLVGFLLFFIGYIVGATAMGVYLIAIGKVQ